MAKRTRLQERGTKQTPSAYHLAQNCICLNPSLEMSLASQVSNWLHAPTCAHRNMSKLLRLLRAFARSISQHRRVASGQGTCRRASCARTYLYNVLVGKRRANFGHPADVEAHHSATETVAPDGQVNVIHYNFSFLVRYGPTKTSGNHATPHPSLSSGTHGQRRSSPQCRLSSAHVS